ncbi:MAG: fasciclin domain-containing protein, partial [Acidimicrobiia bacterium]
MRKRLSFLSLIAGFALVAAACGGTEESTTTTTEPAPTTEAAEEMSVIDLAIAAGGFSTLVQAIEAAGLVETLEGEGPFTVLAPTDQAFEAAFDALGITAEELLADTETLTAILTYHVLPQAADSQLVATLDGESVATVNGAEIQ